MNPLENIPQKLKPPGGLPVNPVARSIAKPDAFMKPGSIGKAGAPTNQSKTTRIRPLGWKRTRGRPRKTVRDVRDVKYF